MTRPVQHFSREYLEACRMLTTEQICRFVEDFRQLIHETGRQENAMSVPAAEPLAQPSETRLTPE